MESMISGPTIKKMLEMGDDIASTGFMRTAGLIMTIAGIKEPPDDLSKAILWSYAKNYLQGFTLEDIKTAFVMNAAGELPKRIEPYGLLDINFISQVMNQYLELKQKALLRARTLLPEPKVAVQTPEEAYAGLVAYCRKNGSMPQYWAWSLVYEYMDEGLMIELTLEQKKALFQSVIGKMQDRLEADIYAARVGLGEVKERQFTMNEDAKAECRKQMVIKFLKWEE